MPGDFGVIPSAKSATFSCMISLMRGMNFAGYDICPYKVAAAAGAVYGVTGFFHTILGCMAGFTSYHSVNGHYTMRNIFGETRGYDRNWHGNISW
jgi:hypothetical protein